jgi:5-methyltetrahydrofolate--homocysteine methyltransferase
VSDVIQELKAEVQKGDGDKVKALVSAAVDQGIAPMDVLEQALRPAMEEVGQKFETLEIYLPEMMRAAEAMKSGVAVLQPHLKAAGGEAHLGTVLVATVEGDVHDIGKNIVGMMLEAVGFNVIDMGYDVPTLSIIERVKELKPQVVGLSALMTSTMIHMPRLITFLGEHGIRDTTKVIVGGAPVLPDWADEIGADGYGENAAEAVNLCKELV